MNSDLGIPSGLAEAGVPPEVLARAADRCFQIDYNRWNPRFTTRDEYYELFERAM
jgi:alcohol dehydrogenase